MHIEQKKDGCLFHGNWGFGYTVFPTHLWVILLLKNWLLVVGNPASNFCRWRKLEPVSSTKPMCQLSQKETSDAVFGSKSNSPNKVGLRNSRLLFCVFNWVVPQNRWCALFVFSPLMAKGSAEWENVFSPLFFLVRPYPFTPR